MWNLAGPRAKLDSSTVVSLINQTYNWPLYVLDSAVIQHSPVSTVLMMLCVLMCEITSSSTINVVAHIFRPCGARCHWLHLLMCVVTEWSGLRVMWKQTGLCDRVHTQKQLSWWLGIKNLLWNIYWPHPQYLQADPLKRYRLLLFLWGILLCVISRFYKCHVTGTRISLFF